MTMWADNIKFVKDILDGKYKKIDDAVAELTENAEILAKEPDSAKSREAVVTSGRTLEIMEPKEIEQLLSTILDDLHEKERETLEQEAKEKLDNRMSALQKFKELKTALKI
eukprot:TRINITY_DN3743_c0_g1_i1.p1 TRINITY_DN3743_c0_g1~~TRINITY_DN3743_c0_g1_i1.p1  ORF type:complete len:111 (-),score=37.93 TRINITY_DN3743_c0_g1_i1:209-541(-)